uniref:Uncharacterized protein n=1 Tax=Rhizophora mucronata TaxID=61149 RepID=A0A2P2QDX3_RHIMU
MSVREGEHTFVWKYVVEVANNDNGSRRLERHQSMLA